MQAPCRIFERPLSPDAATERPSINFGCWRTNRGMKARQAIMLPPMAAGSNGLNGLTNGSTKPTSPAEMTVADLSPTLPSDPSSSNGRTLRKVAVPPRQPVASDVTKAGQQTTYLNGQGRRIPAQAQQVLDQFLSMTGGALAAPNSTNELTVVEAKLKRQAMELREAKAELAEKTAEIQALRAQAMEREGRLRAAKSEIMEARAGAAEKEAKLVELYQILAESGSERARLRDELAQTKMELVETQGELENLADEILAMKELVLNDSELAELNAGMAAAAAENTGNGEQPGKITNTSSFEASLESMSASASAAAEGTWDVLQQLAEMSRQMLDDAKLDEEAFRGAGFFKKLTGVGRSNNGAGDN